METYYDHPGSDDEDPFMAEPLTDPETIKNEANTMRIRMEMLIMKVINAAFITF